MKNKIDTKRSLIVLSVILCSFFFGSLALDNLTGSNKLKKFLQIQYVPTELLCYNKLGELLQRLNLIHIATNKSERYKVSKDQTDLTPNAFQKRRQISNALLSVEPEEVKMQQALDVVKNAHNVEGELLISVVTDTENLTGKDGIITNFEERGRPWEKLAYVAIFEGKKTLLKSAVGLRLHGGKSRHPSLPTHSFRLYFKKKYGVKEIPPGLMFPSNDPVRTLVVHVDTPEGWPFNSIIANKIFKKVGCKTMQYRPAQFYLNGNFQGIYWVSEHLSKKYLNKLLGTKEFTSYKFRGTQRKGRYHVELDDFFNLSNKITVDQVKDIVNIDDLTNYFIALSFSGTTDWWNQGVVYRVNDRNDKRWHWIVWDIDHSFIDMYKENSIRKVWHQPGIGLFLDQRLEKIRLRQHLIFRRLLREDPSYKQLFISTYINTLNHKLTKSYLLELVKENEIQAEKFNISLNPLLKDFLTKRANVIRKQLRSRFSIPPFYKLKFNCSKLDKYYIDGFLESGEYQGYYPKGTEVTLRPVNTNAQKPLYWIVNGKKINSEELKIVVDQKTQIKVFYDSQVPSNSETSKHKSGFKLPGQTITN